MARLKVARSGQRRPGGSRMTSSIYMSVVSAYAPTAEAPPGVKAKFFEELQDALDHVPAGNTLVVLGDFNARVGRKEGANDVWRTVQGKHGIGTCNEPGEQFLEFCALNDFTIMNTWFEKPQVHLVTWKHPATKQPHMIDFVQMRSGQQQLCQDVRVCRSACCWMDHYMVRGKIQLKLPQVKRKSVTHAPLAVHTLCSEKCREEFQQSLSQCLLQHPHCEGGLPEDNWEQLKQCIMETAEECVGRARKKQPDWFQDAVDTLMPLVAAKRRAHNRFLQTPTTAAKKEFRRRQGALKKAVDEAKEEWISRVMREAECARRDGKRRWASIRKLQMAYAGWQPARPTRLCKSNGGMTREPEEVKKTWHEHFSHVLNIPSQYHQAVLDEMISLPPALVLDHPPTLEELIAALSRLKRGKAGGRTGILPELVLYGGPELQERLLLLMDDIWRGGTVVKDWWDAEVVPIPKKGDLKKCDNWRGISLLDVVGKVFAQIMQDRLQVIAERLFPESQCRFRKGTGCMDMIFAARQLIEKSRVHADSLFVLFVDLKKAYDSVPRQALWCVLEKCGMPPVMLSVIKSFHEGMSAVVRVGDSSTDVY